MLLVLLASACGQKKIDPDALPPIDPARAARDADELRRALEAPAHELPKRVGAHRLSEKLRIQVALGGAEVEKLEDQSRLEVQQGGAFSAVHENSRDYGRAVTWDGKRLYVQVRYGPHVERRPEHGEVDRLHDELGGMLPAAWRLLGPFAKHEDGGAVRAGGRDARKIKIALGPPPGELPTGADQAWRQQMQVQALDGEVALDAKSGVPLEGRLSARYSFPKGTGTAAVEMSLERRLEPQPADPVVAAPKGAVPTPRRARYEPERRALLRGLDQGP